ncbi:MAG: glycosyltransferase [Anaerolineae bacterium]|nr:glycosyltransferase [Anaerolineae bacterium]
MNAATTDLCILREGEPIDTAALRRALVIATDSERLAEAVRRDMRVEPHIIRSTEGLHLLEQVALARRAELDANQRISVVITNYNYGRFIADAIDSVLAQTMPVDEIIVVDDASTDDSLHVLERYASQVKAKLIRHPHNRGNPGATRNTGIAAATGAYIICLDADDMLEPTYVETCFNAIRGDIGIGVVYTGVQTLIHGTGQRIVHHHWPLQFSWVWSVAKKTPPNNCIPTASLFRRSMWERCGGYDESIRCGEDAAFWVKALGTGFEARKCTEEPLFVYRRHGPSISTTRTWDDLSIYHRAYTGYKPLAAPTGEARIAALAVPSFERPVVSVIIPCGAKHARYLPTAIESVLAQTFAQWEIVVANDTGDTLPLKPYPFVRVVNTSAPGSGSSAARNAGIEAARAPLVLFLDADDWLLPSALETMLRAYAKGNAGYVYCDWWAVDGAAPARVVSTRDYDRRAWLDPNTNGLHPVTVLMSRGDAISVGMFNESTRGFEDWEFFIRCAIAGLCGARIRQPLLAYRTHTGVNRERSLALRKEIVASLMDRYGAHMSGEEELVACCGGDAKAVSAVQDALPQTKSLHYEIAPDGTVEMAYTGLHRGEVTYFGKYTGCIGCKPIRAEAGDVKRLEMTGVWRVVEKTLPPAPEPAVIE